MRVRASLVVLIAAIALRPGWLFARTDETKKPIQPGESGTVTFTVAGTTEPVRVHMVNRTRDVVTVQGGDDQIVMSSGGEKNTVTLGITGLRVGIPSFSMELDTSDLDTVFRRVLRKVVEDTRKRVAALEPARTPSGRATYKLSDVVDVLRRIALDIDAALPDRKFAPFRDAIHSYVGALEKRATERATRFSPSAMTTRGASANIVRISYQRAASAEAVDRESADSIFGDVLSLLEGTADKGSEREICVRTDPTDYEISIFSRSYPDDKQTVTAASLMTLTVGAYKYRIREQKRNKESSGDLNLLLNSEFIIKCPVKFEDGDPEACQYLAGGARPCR